MKYPQLSSTQQAVFEQCQTILQHEGRPDDLGVLWALNDESSTQRVAIAQTKTRIVVMVPTASDWDLVFVATNSDSATEAGLVTYHLSPSWLSELLEWATACATQENDSELDNAA